jgi:hypothetical protein
MDFSGHLTAFPAANILQWAAQERRTGALVVRRSRCEKRLYFVDGRVVAATSDDPGESYGRHLLLFGHLDESQLLRALQRCSQVRRRLGAVLVELELLGAATVRDTLRQHFLDVVCDVFLWPRGVFYFEAEPPPKEEIPPSSVDTMGLVLEGTRWVDELARIRKIFVHDNVVLRHGPKYPVGELTPFEARVGATVDNRSSLAELHTTLRGSYFRFVDAAYRLCMREVLDIASIGEGVGGESLTAELRLPDVILERERPPERLSAVPVAALYGLYPVLSSFPEASLLERYPRAVVDFLSGLDGQTALADLLGSDHETAQQQVDALLVELRQGRLALLPAPVRSLEEAADARDEPVAARWWRRVLPGRK